MYRPTCSKTGWAASERISSQNDNFKYCFYKKNQAFKLQCFDRFSKCKIAQLDWRLMQANANLRISATFLYDTGSLSSCRCILVWHDVNMWQKLSATNSALDLGEVHHIQSNTIKFILLQKEGGI